MAARSVDSFSWRSVGKSGIIWLWQNIGAGRIQGIGYSIILYLSQFLICLIERDYLSIRILLNIHQHARKSTYKCFESEKFRKTKKHEEQKIKQLSDLLLNYLSDIFFLFYIFS